VGLIHLKETTMTTTTKTLCYGDLLWSEMHGKYVRFLRYDGSYIVVCDRNTLVELPDHCHPALIRVC
jgi:hypothetical protein